MCWARGWDQKALRICWRGGCIRRRGRNLRPLSTWLAVGECAGKEAGSPPSAHARQGLRDEAFVGKASGTLIWTARWCAGADLPEAVGGILGEEAGSPELPRWHFLLDTERVQLQRAEPSSPDPLSREEGRQRGGWSWGLRQGEMKPQSGHLPPGAAPLPHLFIPIPLPRI